MSLPDLVILLSSGVLVLVVLLVAVVAWVEERRPAMRGRLEQVIRSVGNAKEGDRP